MGAPPGLGGTASQPLPTNTPLPVTASGKSDSKTPDLSGSGAPASSPPPSKFQQAIQPLALMGVDEKRARLARGLRLYSGQHLDGAKLELEPLTDSRLAQDVIGQVQNQDSVFHARQASLVLKALVQDTAQSSSLSEADQSSLLRMIDAVEAELLLSGGQDLGKAIQAARGKVEAPLGQAWDRFAQAQRTALAEITDAFLETDPSLLAEGLLRLSDQYRERKLYGTSWALAQIAAENPKTAKHAKEISDYLEGKRTSTEYVLSDMFDHGGSSMAIDLLALLPSVALTRKLAATRFLVEMSAWKRIPLTLVAGGLIHWTSSKAIMAVSGYDGKILPGSFRQFGGELASSTLQNGLALALANRKFMFGKSVASKEAAAAVETTEATEATAKVVKPVQRAWTLTKTGAAKFLRGSFWTTKMALKLGLISATDLLLVQAPLHYFGVNSMTPRGLPRYAMWLFPGTRDTRTAVAETYAARRLFRDYQKKGEVGKKITSAIPGIDPSLDLDLFLTQLDPDINDGKREAAYAVLAEAAAGGKFGLNIRRWILQKKKLGELGGANRTLERQGIPLRYEQDGSLCFTDSQDYPCGELAVDKP